MTKLTTTAWSSVGKKFIMGFTGLVWVSFATVHLIGNSMLFSSNSSHFNSYAHFLLSLGELLYLFEAALIFTLLFHAASAVTVWWGSRKARPIAYHKTANAGGSSRKSISSVTMIYTGILLFSFLVFHVWTFKYGAYYTITVHGEEMRDLYRLVYESFGKLWYTSTYVIILVLLGFHLRHGFWSAFQSLGFSHPRYSPFIYGLGYTLAVILALGFIAIPLWIFFKGGV